jgi:hypothetical protein
MKTVATVALSDFPFWKMCMEKLRTQVDEIHVRIDGTKPNKLDELIESKLADSIFISQLEWNRWNWRNEMLEMIKGRNADIVLIPDHDEMYEDTIVEELKEFWLSGKDMMFFEFYNPTIDNRIIPELNGKGYPSLAHCSAFRYKPELTYYPYCGLAQPTQYANGGSRFNAKTKVKHFCFYTKELEIEKKAWVKKEYGIF